MQWESTAGRILEVLKVHHKYHRQSWDKLYIVHSECGSETIPLCE